jgi:ABC-type transport system substrate-binding protein/tetratricopeptide (TPR) repeat protein
MTTSCCQLGRLLLPLRIVLALSLCAFTGGVLILAGSGDARRWGAVRQKKDDKADKKRVEEEEDDPKVKPKKRVEDEEEPRKHKVVRVDEDEEKPARPVAGAVDLNKAKREVKHPGIRELFTKLAVPYDEVTLRDATNVTVEGAIRRGGKIHVAPLPDYIIDLRTVKKKLTLKILDDDGKELKSESLGPNALTEIRYYERIALDEVKAFLDYDSASLDTTNPRYLPRYEQLLAAEQALSAVVRFHRSARERDIRKGDGWEGVESDLRKLLLDVELKQLHELGEAKAFDQAFSLTRRLAETYTDKEDIKRIAKPLAELLQKAMDDPTYGRERIKEARKRLQQIEERFPGSTEAVSKGLRDKAQGLMKQAEAFLKEKKNAEALHALKEAEELYPELPGLRALRIATDDAFPILRVSMRELPKYLSPAWAFTDPERRCVDLLFESLVQLLPDDRGVMYYQPSLAAGQLSLIPRGRQVQLPRGARWSDNGPLTAGDLRFTLNLLREGRGTGRCAAWGNLLEDLHVGGDPFRVKLRLRQGFLDPLAVMSFKVLPQRGRPDPKSEQFAEKPISSGPFLFGGPDTENGRPFVSFPANPHYGVRPDKPGLPRLKQVRVFAPPDPVKAASDGAVSYDLLLDLTAEQASALAKDFVVLMPTEQVPNQRIYFLAVNHRRPALAHADMRLALAKAINREGILDAHFRKGLGRKVHKAINGPYPAGSWACNPKLVNRTNPSSLDPFDTDAVGAKLRLVMPKLGVRELRLSLKYPEGDKMLEAAMTDLCDRVNKLQQSVRLVAEKCPPHQLRMDVEETHSYDLAYYSYEFHDESFWLMPLLGPSGPGGSENYLGYNGPLVSRIQSAAALRHFSQVRDFAHAIHSQMLVSEMPIIPLWQLDPLCAYRKGRLKLPPLDPNRVFAQSELWRVDAGGGK